MEPNAMITVGLVPSQQLVSLLTDDDGNWRDVPEGQTPVPLVKMPKPEQGAWEPNLVWFDDRVERQWVAGTPAPAPLYSPEDWTAKFFTAPQILALQRFEFALQQAGKPLGSNMSALKTWLEQMLLASADPTPRSDWQEPSVTYADAAQEAVTALSTP